MTWRQLSMLLGQLSLSAFGAHMVSTEQMGELIGAIIVAGVVALAIIGSLGEAGARQIVAGVRAWRGPDRGGVDRPPGGPGPGGPS